MAVNLSLHLSSNTRVIQVMMRDYGYVNRENKNLFVRTVLLMLISKFLK